MEKHTINFTIREQYTDEEKKFLRMLKNKHNWVDFKNDGNFYCMNCNCNIEKCTEYKK